MHPDGPPARPSMHRAVPIALGLVLALTTIVAGAPTAASAPVDENPGGIGLRLLDAPVSAKDDPRARVYIVDHLAPGTVIERRIEVTNTTDREQDVVLYSAAATIENGVFIGEAGRKRNDLASWTAVMPGAATVSAGSEQIAVVEISVPDDAAPGEQYGVVWAEARSEPTDGGGVAQVSRVGIRLYVSVGPGGAPAADFEVQSLTAGRSADGSPVVSATVQNTGGRALDLNGTLELTNGPGGLAAGPFTAELGSTLAVGDTESVRIALDDRLPDGPWDAVVTLESGLVERSATATVRFPASGEAAAVPVTEDSSGQPWAILLGVAALLLLCVVVGARLLPRRPKGRHEQAAAGTRSRRHPVVP